MGLHRRYIFTPYAPYLILFSYFLILLIQGILIESVIWKCFSSPLDGFGWKIGFLYGLFCIFISAVEILSAILEKPFQYALRLGCPPMEKLKDPNSKVCCHLLTEILEFRKFKKPDLFLIPSDEINAFSFQVGHDGALFVTRGALFSLSRSQLKVLLTRQLLQLKDPYLKKVIPLCLSIKGFSALFFSGSTLLKQSNFGKFETRKKYKKGHPSYFIGLIPLLAGLPSWWMARIYLLWLSPDQVFLADAEVSKSPENAREMIGILEKIHLQPLDDMPVSTWPMRFLGLHHEGFLEDILPIQPRIEERIQRLKELS